MRKPEKVLLKTLDCLWNSEKKVPVKNIPILKTIETSVAGLPNKVYHGKRNYPNLRFVYVHLPNRIFPKVRLLSSFTQNKNVSFTKGLFTRKKNEVLLPEVRLPRQNLNFVYQGVCLPETFWSSFTKSFLRKLILPC